MSVNLPVASGETEFYVLHPPSPFPRIHPPVSARTAFAAAHVVADPLALSNSWQEPAVDWEATLAFRRHLWGLGLKVAEAMDTSQRGVGLDWPLASELIRRSIAEARSIPGADLACGAGTDQLAPGQAKSLEDVIAAYEEQIAHIEACGGRAIIMASRALCRLSRSADDFLFVYDRLLSAVREKVILHWLGEMFDPELAGYWGNHDIDIAMGTLLGLLKAHVAKVDGVKISLLDRGREECLRKQLPPTLKLYTGDDLNYVELIEGDGEHVSHGLLGIFDPIAPAVVVALDRLAAGDNAGYHEILDPTIALSRKMFEAPTRFYKAGVVFLAWIAGHQTHFRMIGGMESARSILHYAELFRLADQARLYPDPEHAAWRMRQFCAVNGVLQ
jgi:hypothetical protein